MSVSVCLAVCVCLSTVRLVANYYTPFTFYLTCRYAAVMLTNFTRHNITAGTTN